MDATNSDIVKGAAAEAFLKADITLLDLPW